MNQGPRVQMKQFIAYYRVSTDRQGQSGLGLDAQREAVRNFLHRENGILFSEYTEVESGSVKERPELVSALATCRKRKAVLVIAKLDRLARNVHVISGLLESGVEFVAVDNPHASKLLLHLLSAFAEHEREQIGIRTRSALSAAKRRGTILGATGTQRAKENREAADEFARKLAPLLTNLNDCGIQTASGLADKLNKSGTPTWRGCRWHPATVIRLKHRLRALNLP